MTTPSKPTPSTVPTPPVRGDDKTVFNQRTQALLSWYPTHYADLNASLNYINASNTFVEQSVSAAAASANSSANSASAAATQASAAQTAKMASEAARDLSQNYAALAGAAAGGGALAGKAFKFARVNTLENGFDYIDAPSNITPDTKTAAYTLTAADKTKRINCTGTWTLAFASAASLGNGWATYVANTGTGDITLDPSGTELIDSLSSYIMYPGEVRLIICDGTALSSIVIQPFFKEVSVSGVFIKPPGYRLFEGFLWGAGASGAACNCPGVIAMYFASAGLGGSCSPFTFLASTMAASINVIIGSGGAPVSVGYNGSFSYVDGNIGGDSSFNGVTAYGGYKGTVSSNSVAIAPCGSGIFGQASSFGRIAGAPYSQPAVVSTPSAESAYTGASNIYGGGFGGYIGPSADQGLRAINGGHSIFGSGGHPGCLVNIAQFGSASKTLYAGAHGRGIATYNGGYKAPLGETTYGGFGGDADIKTGSTNATASPGSQKGGGGGSAGIINATGGTATSGKGGDGFMQIWGKV